MYTRSVRYYKEVYLQILVDVHVYSYNQVVNGTINIISRRIIYKDF